MFELINRITLSWHQFCSISWLTSLEAIRQPITLLLFTFTIAFIGVLPLSVAFTLRENMILICDSALALHFVSGLLIGCYSACSSLSSEIHKGTASAVLSKPVARHIFFLAKFTGVAQVMLMFSLTLAMATIISARTAAEAFFIDWWSAGPLLLAVGLAYLISAVVNYIGGRPFCSTAFLMLMVCVFCAFLFAAFIDNKGHWISFGALYAWNLTPLSTLIAMAVMVLAAIAVSLATSLDTVPTLTICSIIFLLGLMSDHMFGRFAQTHFLAGLLYRLIPNWQHFWVTDALRIAEQVPWSYVGKVGVYALFYIGGVLLLGLAMFRKMELK